MLSIRIITAFVLVTFIVFGLNFVENLSVTLALFVLFASLAGAEFIALRWTVLNEKSAIERAKPEMNSLHYVIGAFYGIGILIWVVGNSLSANNERNFFSLASNTEIGHIFLLFWMAIGMMILSSYLYYQKIDMNLLVHKVMNALAGFAYISLPLLVMYWLAVLSCGPIRAYGLYYSLAIIFMGDTGAYFFGRMFGRHKLAVRVSPKKTVEGALGGLFCSGFTAGILVWFYPIGFPLWQAVIMGVCAGLIGQIGDLFESAIKRAANCKDSSRLLPGHGGVLDRIDSLLFAIPLCYFALVILRG